MCAWTAGVTRSTGDLISAADWNGYLGANGSLNYLHVGSHVTVGQLTYVSGSTWQTGSNYVSGKILNLAWNNVAVPTLSGWITEAAANRITFTQAMLDKLNGGIATPATDVVVATWIKAE